ncbi:phosphoadenosine phosphosulfate reductase [Pontibacillus halophilus JSM 076056 = DSM 19796]|uniref:Adenosine 5'-phosphosulfate reductase n=1 Tax=Pontibacillus halophilus JSM 076056 = DSM 19796 TaxID=1385510 RepID=A0A0A5GIA7_9BACI|nr:phosphoadenylyl-sulfate reductase [Pontibacillus halophilus]KGX92971.1 phosphoadenosine phosphosulfate reductase [Pontibacillus halophilus JSM 076056 = DSM 19796]
MATVTYEQWQGNPLTNLSSQSIVEESEKVLDWAYSEYGEELTYACSFGAEGIVLIDMIARIKEDARIVFLDTGLHFQETYELIERMKERFPKLNIVMKKPELTVQQQADQHGDELWKKEPNQCCYIRKIKPLEEALSGSTAWVSGLRREQSPSRRATEFVNKDERFRSVKVCPLIHWTWDDVWTYIKEQDLPYNDLHDKGYPSIGCAPCTMPTDNPYDLRSGRWSTMDKTECGLHMNPNRPKQ